MKNVITFLKTLWGAWGNLLSNDTICDRRLTVGSPSGLDAKWKQKGNMEQKGETSTSCLQLASYLPLTCPLSASYSAVSRFYLASLICVLMLTLGVGNAWGAASTVTYTISSLNTLSASGTEPVGTIASIVETYSTSCQMTGSNSQTFTLTNMGTSTISDITLSMHSNSGSGKGRLKYSTDGGSTWTYLVGESSDVNFNNAAWNGAYTTSYVNISKGVTITCESGKDFIIKIECGGNSLFCQSYSITYTPPTAYTVTWQKYGTSHTSTSVLNGGRPIFPSNPSNCGDLVSTAFYGWTQTAWSGKTDDISDKTTTVTKIYRSASAMPVVTDAVTYHAVWAKRVAGDETHITGGSCVSAYPSQAESGTWSHGGTGDYFSNSPPHGVKFDNVGDYIQSEDISSGNYTCVVVKIKSGYNGTGSGSVLTITTIDASGNVITSGTITPTDTWTSQTNVYEKELEGEEVIKYVRVTMTSRTANMGMEYCEVFNKPPTYSKYMTNCCDALGAVDGDVTLTETAFTITAEWPMTEDGNETGYSVQLYDNNGTGVKGDAIGDPVAITGTGDANRTYTFTNLTHSHEYFVGVTPTYSGDGDYCATGTEVTANATTNAAYTVTYANGGGTGTMTDSNSPYEAGDEVTVLTNTFTRPGYPFDSWSAVDASSNVIDVSSGSFTMPSSNVTITATWGSALQDEFLDKEHGNSRQTRSGANKTTPTCGNYTPVNEYCADLHYKFVGWVLSTSVNDDGTLKNDAVIVPGGQGSWNCTGSTYYAVWAAENE